MDINHCVREAFAVIGMEGSTEDGEGFIEALWRKANDRFAEISGCAKTDDAGRAWGIWGLMSDFSRSFLPWQEGFTKGLYLAGVEAVEGAEPPAGWARWEVPAFEYLYVKAGEAPGDDFCAVLDYMKENGLPLAGAVHEFMRPEENGQLYLFFPIRRM